MKSLQQSQTTSFEQQQTNKLSSQLIKCSQGKDAYKLCSDHKCQKLPFMCLEQQCQCNKEHQRCLKILIQSFKTSIRNKLISYKPIEEKIKEQIQKSIDDLSKLQQQLLKQCKEKQSQLIGLNNVQKWLMYKFKTGNIKKANITGRYLYSVLKNLKKPPNIIKITNDLQQDINKIFYQLNNDIKKLQNKLKMTIQNFGFNFFKNSNLIKKSNQQILISNFFNSQSQNIQSVQLLYRASDNQYLASKFHQLCDGKTNTITICENTFGKKFGGYTPLAWNQKNQQINDKTCKSFTFSLTNNHKFINKSGVNAIIGDKNYGPIFGDNTKCDIAIANKCNQNDKSFCNINKTYKNQNYIQGDKKSQIMMTSVLNGNSFKVKDYQVWKINFVQ